MTGFPYRREQRPPYPALRIELSCAGRSHACEGKIDTGASRTCVPAWVLSQVSAAPTRPAVLVGFDGRPQHTWTYYVTIRVIEPGWPEAVPARFEDVQVCGIRDGESAMAPEVLIGRDLLRNWALLLEGPHDTLHVQA